MVPPVSTISTNFEVFNLWREVAGSNFGVRVVFHDLILSTPRKAREASSEVTY